MGAEATARELPRLGLLDALELTLLIARKEPRRHPRIAARWLLRFLEEDDEATIDGLAFVASCPATSRTRTKFEGRSGTKHFHNGGTAPASSGGGCQGSKMAMMAASHGSLEQTGCGEKGLGSVIRALWGSGWTRLPLTRSRHVTSGPIWQELTSVPPRLWSHRVERPFAESLQLSNAA
jgi:hypothetical protein